MKKQMLILAVSTFVLVQACPAESSTPAEEQAELPDAGTIKGKVFDAEGQTVAGAVVILCNQKTGVPVSKSTFRPFTEAVLAGKGDPLKNIVYAVADEQGGFYFEKIPAGEYRLVAQSWKDAEKFKGIFEINGKEIQLHGTAEHIQVSPDISPDIELRPLGTGVLQIDEQMPNDETLLVISTAPTQADPILGFAGWGGLFIRNMIGGNRMPGGKTTVYGLPEGKVYFAMFAADSVPGWTEGEAEIESNKTTVMDYIQFVNSWSNSRHEPPQRLRPLFEEIKSLSLASIQEIPALAEFYKALEDEEPKGIWGYQQLIIPYLNKEFQLPSGRKTTFGEVIAAAQYVQLQEFVKRRDEKRKKRAKLIEQLKARHIAKIKEGKFTKPVDYTSPSTFFPDDPESTRELEILLVNKDSIFQPPPYGEWLDIIRRGFRQANVDKQGLLSTISYKYIQRQSPPSQLALDIIYYASFDPRLKRSALYYGLTVAKPKPPKVLKRLVDLAMEGCQVGRIAWGVQDQREEFLNFLKPYLSSSDPKEIQQAQNIRYKVLDFGAQTRRVETEKR